VYQTTVVRILQCLVHKIDDIQYVFILVQKFQLLPQIDSILEMPLYTSTNDWELIGLCSLDSQECLFMIDVSTSPEFKSLSDSTIFLRCDWGVDYM
jgi:hypothetical protein